MKKSAPLRYNGQWLGTRINLFEHHLNLRLVKKGKPNMTIKQRMKYIEEVKKQQQNWEKLWKYFVEQSKLKKNKRNKNEIESAIIECELNFNKADRAIKNQQKLLVDQLREK